MVVQIFQWFSKNKNSKQNSDGNNVQSQMVNGWWPRCVRWNVDWIVFDVLLYNSSIGFIISGDNCFYTCLIVLLFLSFLKATVKHQHQVQCPGSSKEYYMWFGIESIAMGFWNTFFVMKNIPNNKSQFALYNRWSPVKQIH